MTGNIDNEGKVGEENVRFMATGVVSMLQVKQFGSLSIDNPL